VSFKLDKDDPHDVEKLGRFLEQNPQFAPIPQQHKLKEEVVQGEKFEIIIKKYEERKNGKLSPKTLYGYLRYIAIFKEWAENHFNNKDFLITTVDRKIVASYISHLRRINISDNTIGKNYLICLNSIFDFAKSIGEYPDIDAPSRLHNLVNEKDDGKVIRNPFTEDDLKIIFAPENLPKNGHPEQFWAPLIALFTGARISEICQLHRIDIVKRNEFYTISINDEEEKRVKSKAGKRIIPIHPILIEIGFVEYMNDMKKFGNQIFPTVKPDIFGYFGKEPSRRWANYSDKIGITDKTKVFHSFRSTANITLIDAGIEEEKRCAFIGHDHNTVNSKVYGHKGNNERSKFTPEFLFNLIIPVLKFDVDFSKIKYKTGMFDKFIYRELARVERQKERQEKLKALGKKKTGNLK